jgi:hypothetical protein
MPLAALFGGDQIGLVKMRSGWLSFSSSVPKTMTAGMLAGEAISRS